MRSQHLGGTAEPNPPALKWWRERVTRVQGTHAIPAGALRGALQTLTAQASVGGSTGGRQQPLCWKRRLPRDPYLPERSATASLSQVAKAAEFGGVRPRLAYLGQACQELHRVLR